MSWSCTATAEAKDDGSSSSFAGSLVTVTRLFDDGGDGNDCSGDDDCSFEDGSAPFLLHLPSSPTNRRREERRTYDVRLQRDWMEYVDDSGVSAGLSDGSSAYDFLRCDLVFAGSSCGGGGGGGGDNGPSSSSSDSSFLEEKANAGADAGVDGGRCETRWNVWGEEFHLNRLRSSYHELVRRRKQSSGECDGVRVGAEERTREEEEEEERALRDSRAVIRSLLFEARRSMLLESIRRRGAAETETETESATRVGRGQGGEETKGRHRDNVLAQMVRVTLMWTPTRGEEGEGGSSGDDSRAMPTSSAKAGKQRLPRTRIVVRGHASSTGEAFSPHRRPRPIVAGLAVQGGGRSNDDLSTSSSSSGATVNHGAVGTAAAAVNSNANAKNSLPNRQMSPNIKISSWSRLRRPLETKRFMPPGASEVLMVRPALLRHTAARRKEEEEDEEEMEILEGLTSNFFAVYRDGTIRTARDGVLDGYARHLVLKVAARCGLKEAAVAVAADGAAIQNKDDEDYLHRPTSSVPPQVLLRDAIEGRWAEAFITSSSRLIFPIERIVAPKGSLGLLMRRTGGNSEEEEEEEGDRNDDDVDDNDLRFEEIWSAPRIDESLPWKTPRWEALYDEMLREGGYD